MTHGSARALRYGRLWQGIGWLLVLTVMVLSLMPQPPQPPGLTWDKAQHLLAYGVLMLWFRQAFAPRRRWIGFLVLLGVGLECLQGLSGGRHFEYADMLANTLGVGCGLLLAATPLGTVAPRLDRWLAGK
ncbi:MAG: VanZ family protein [Pseudomonadota bacterium]|nr:VanZ family protein [Pseudomonadota bacterium]